MKSKIAFVPLAIAVILLFSGCGPKAENSRTEEQKNMGLKQEQDPGYVEGMLGIKEKAEQDINNAVNKENNKINNAMNGENLDYVKKYDSAEIETNLGKIKVKFYNTDAPKTVDNFLKLAEQKFYDGTKFHRVIKDFMIQGGDPNSKSGNPSTWGTGGPGYAFEDEFNIHKLMKGSLAMANSGPGTNGSQFFIVTAESTPWLDGKHTNFGEVISGMDTVEKIENAKTVTNDRPSEDIIIKSIELFEER